MPGRPQTVLKAKREGNSVEGAVDLLLSASPRPAIQLERQPTPPQRFRPPWCPVSISLGALTKLLDALILLCAILFFAVMALVITNILPPWPIAILFAIGITAVFVTLYWFLFVFWIGSTPGEHLAQMACSESRSIAPGDQED